MTEVPSGGPLSFSADRLVKYDLWIKAWELYENRGNLSPEVLQAKIYALGLTMDDLTNRFGQPLQKQKRS